MKTDKRVISSSKLLIVFMIFGIFWSFDLHTALKTGPATEGLEPGHAFGTLLSLDMRNALGEDDNQGESIDLGQAFIAAYESNNQAEMLKLVKENKNAVSKELINIISYATATSGEVTVEEMLYLIKVTEKMAGIYSSEFSDARLEKFVANYKKWTKNEQEKKKEADIIFFSYKKELKNKNYEAVVEKWDKSLEIYQQLGDRLSEANRMDEIGITFGKLGSFKTSIKFLSDARQINKEIGNPFGEISNLRYIATGYIAMEDYPSAIETYKSALNITRELGSKNDEDALLFEIDSIESKLKNAKAETK